MPFHSILFENPQDAPDSESPQEPGYFTDLNLDQVIDAVTRDRGEYDLVPYFRTPLHSADAIAYRHEVLHDLEDEALRAAVDAFAERMRRMRTQLAQADGLHYRYQQETWLLDAVETYGRAVTALADDLRQEQPASRGFRALCDYLAGYCASGRFTALIDQSRQVRAELARVQYSLHIDGSKVRVTRLEQEADLGERVATTFAKFEQGAVHDYRLTYQDRPELNPMEAGILELVAQLYPREFSGLDDFAARHRDYLDATVADFDRQVQFYLAWRDHTSGLAAHGLPFCYPQISTESKEVAGTGVFDLALADRLVEAGQTVVRNDFQLHDPERVFVVSGPNQGGKTTFARTFGQLHYLAALGCPVPGTGARLFLFDHLFTHFEREEDLDDLSGKLQDDLTRIHAILEQATAHSIVIMNEIFTSTTLHDALTLGTRVLEEVIERDLLCVYVTFVDELSRLGPSTVSLVSTVVPDDPATRTYRLDRKPADGLSYAASLAEKYQVSYQALHERIPS